MTFFDCTADLVGQLNGNGQKGMLQIDCRKSLATRTGSHVGLVCLRDEVAACSCSVHAAIIIDN